MPSSTPSAAGCSLSTASKRYHYLTQALNANGLFFKKWEVQVWLNAYGENGLINWFNFLSHLREPMGPVRRALVEDIFNGLDPERKGKVDVEKLSKCRVT